MKGIHNIPDKTTALITGASGGIGYEFAKVFAGHGHDLVLVARSEDKLNQLAEDLRAAHGLSVNVIPKDLCAPHAASQLFEELRRAGARIDILVNNAGVEPHAPILELDEWDWRRTLDVNLSGPFFTMQSVGRVMREQGGGVIVNIASIAGRAHGLRDRSAYVASKTGLIGLTREAAREFAPYNIRVNAVCPGVIETEMTAILRQDETMLRKWLEDIPQGRLGRVEDVVGMVLFLCSASAAYVTGQAINVDGGKVMC